MLILGISCCIVMTLLSFVSICAIYMRKRKTWKPKADESNESNDSSSDKKSGGSGTKESGGDWKKTGITFYGQNKADDNGTGFAGVDLFKHGTAGLTFEGKPLFPVAVFQGDAAGMLWKIIEVKSDAFTKNKTVYGHIVDVCNSGESVCKKNTAKHGYLVDIHKTAFSYVGADDGLHAGEFRKVGELKPSKISANIWLKEGTVACSCSGGCKGNDVKWIKHSKC